jgi:pimeloyl-ACP methyl ester carboxylesterase
MEGVAMKTSRSLLLACLLAGAMSIIVMPVIFPALGAGPKGTVIKFTVPKQLNMLYDGTYNCWIPDSVGTIRCIIVHQHGCTREGDAQMMMNDVQWLTFAKKWHAAFIAPALITGAPGTGSTQCSNWCTMSNGSGNSFLMALDTLARRAGHPEIKTVPWAIWGHSGGSLWMTAMAATYPDRIAVGVAQSGSVEMSNTAGALKIPILHHNGRKDMIYNDVQFANGRTKNALWAHAINPHPLWVTGSCVPPNKLCWDTTVYGHAPWDLRMIAIPWMDIALTSRLPDQAGASQLKDMDTTNAWFGDTATRAIASAATFTGNKSAACWFPNQRWAKMWQEYMATGTQKDSTPPPAPYNLTGTYANRQIVLKWDADADLETGIKTFIIYRNGSLLQKMTWPNAPSTLFTTEKGFQRWDDGDQPNPTPAPNMTFTDANLSDTGTYIYQVSTVNWSDVEGPKSAAIALSHGQVTGTIASRNKTAASFSPVSRCWNLDNGRLDLRAGIIDIYDIRGCLLKTVAVKNGGRMDVKTLLGASAEKMVMVRNRVK